jgi:hypothetical protein
VGEYQVSRPDRTATTEPAAHTLQRAIVFEQTVAGLEPRDAFPWLLAQVLEVREIVAFTRLDELPLDATRDRVALTESSSRARFRRW